MSSGNKCASGSGEFFPQQVKRMSLDAEKAVEMAEQGEPYTLSGRCSVFCKSDCTRALNKGKPIPNVAAGLCRMIAAKMDELLAPVPHKHVLVVGGTAQNRTVIRYLREKLNTRNGGVRLTIPREVPYFEALGAARLAYDKGMPRPAELLKPEQSAGENR